MPEDDAEYLIEPAELSAISGDESLRIFDATVLFGSQQESAYDRYLQAHIPKAAFLDHQVLSDSDSPYMYMLPDAGKLGEAIGELGVSNDDEVVVYSSDTLMWATRAFWVLRYAGHNRVRILNGGLQAWRAFGGEIDSDSYVHTPRRFTPALRPAMIVGYDQVLAAIGDAQVCTINALPESYYRGTSEAGYAAAGHITGSTNTPYSEIAPGERFPDKTTLRNVLAAAGYLGGEKVISYCGGGIAATVSATACLLAGKDNVAVYDGSLHEWLSQGGPTTLGSDPGKL